MIHSPLPTHQSTQACDDAVTGQAFMQAPQQLSSSHRDGCQDQLSQPQIKAPCSQPPLRKKQHSKLQSSACKMKLLRSLAADCAQGALLIKRCPIPKVKTKGPATCAPLDPSSPSICRETVEQTVTGWQSLLHAR